MPSATTMLFTYQAQLAASRGSGLAGVSEQARLSGVIRVLLDVINTDYETRSR